MKLRIETGQTLASLAPLLVGEKEVYLVYDRRVAWAAQPFVAGAVGSIALDVCEKGKTLDTVLTLCRSFLEAGLSRDALVLSVGGGITSDLSGLAASLYKRGIRYACVPTTLLAQVDAAIGGKTGVNLDTYKNMLGVIVQPVFTFLTPQVLRTLGERERRSGAAELLKTFLIGDAASYAETLRALSAGADPEALGELIFRAASLKASIVERDPYERGERRILNLGHTFAHALEREAALRGEDLSHGEAVAVGIVLAARLSERLGLGETGIEARLRADFSAAGLLTSCPYPLPCLATGMGKDKKTAGGKVSFILPVRPGEVVIRPLAPEGALRLLLPEA